MLSNNRNKEKDYNKYSFWLSVIVAIITLIGLLFGEGLLKKTVNAEKIDAPDNSKQVSAWVTNGTDDVTAETKPDKIDYNSDEIYVDNSEGTKEEQGEARLIDLIMAITDNSEDNNQEKH